MSTFVRCPMRYYKQIIIIIIIIIHCSIFVITQAVEKSACKFGEI